MTSSYNNLYKIRWWLMVALVVIAPFHAFLITWLKSAAGNNVLTAAISIWREAIIVLISGLIVFELSTGKEKRPFDKLDWSIIAFSAVAFVWLTFQLDTSNQWLLGFRFDVLPLLFLLLVRRVAWHNKIIIAKAALIAASVVLVFGILQAAVLPQNFLARFGYSEYHGEYESGIAITGCQYLEHTTKFCRAISTFGGPTRYGTYLMLVFGLLIPFLMQKSLWRIYAAVLFLLVLANSALTYSRSIWIGVFVMLIVWLYLALKAKMAYGKIKFSKKRIIIGAIIFITLALSIFSAFKTFDAVLFQNLKTIFVRATSTSEHAELLKNGIKTALENPFGLGLGTVGPASVRFQKLLTENWYVQIADEMGFIGLIAFLAAMFLLAKKLLKDRFNWTRIGLFLSLLGIMTAGLFTHSFEETSTVVILFGLIGTL